MVLYIVSHFRDRHISNRPHAFRDMIYPTTKTPKEPPMEYKRSGNTLIVRLDKDDEILASMLELAAQESITAASITGIGATDDFRIGIFDLKKHAYDEFPYTGAFEITNLTGNLTTKGGNPYVHLHMTAGGKEGTTISGHLLYAHISLTAEIFVNVIDTRVERFYDEDLRINRLNLNE